MLMGTPKSSCASRLKRPMRPSAVPTSTSWLVGEMHEAVTLNWAKLPFSQPSHSDHPEPFWKENVRPSVGNVHTMASSGPVMTRYPKQSLTVVMLSRSRLMGSLITDSERASLMTNRRRSSHQANCWLALMTLYGALLPSSRVTDGDQPAGMPVSLTNGSGENTWSDLVPKQNTSLVFSHTASTASGLASALKCPAAPNTVPSVHTSIPAYVVLPL